jgi:hypothetical protein
MNRSSHSSFDAKESFFKLPKKLKGDALAARVKADLAKWEEYSRIMARPEAAAAAEFSPELPAPAAAMLEESDLDWQCRRDTTAEKERERHFYSDDPDRHSPFSKWGLR